MKQMQNAKFSFEKKRKNASLRLLYYLDRPPIPRPWISKVHVLHLQKRKYFAANRTVTVNFGHINIACKANDLQGT